MTTAIDTKIQEAGMALDREISLCNAARDRLDDLPNGTPYRGRRERALKKTIRQKERKIDALRTRHTILVEERTAEAEANEKAIRETEAAAFARDAEQKIDDANDLDSVLAADAEIRASKRALADALGVDPSTIKDVDLDKKF